MRQRWVAVKILRANPKRITIDLSRVSEKKFQEMIQLGAKYMVNRGMLTLPDYPPKEKDVIERARENVKAMYRKRNGRGR